MASTLAHHRVDEAHNLKLVGWSDLGGSGDAMHVNIKDGFAFVAHMGATGTSILDVRDPRDPRLVGRIPVPLGDNTRSHKVQIVGDTLLINRERKHERTGGGRGRPWVAGISTYDVSNPLEPRQLGFWSAGGRGVHRMTYWEEPYCYASAGSSMFDRGMSSRDGREILAIIDMSDPAAPVEVARWWLPGMRHDEGHLRTWGDDKIVKLHHGIPRGDRLYCGWWDAGLVILDISDRTDPKFVSRLDFDSVDGPSLNTHSACPLPGRDVLVVTDECNDDDHNRIEYQVRLVDISDDRNPKLLSRLPVPEGDYPTRGARFGPHNVHEMRPGSFQSSDIVFVTYFNAGIRVYDVSDAGNPREIAYYVPKSPKGRPSIQLNDVLVDTDGLVYVTDRYSGGLYILELDV